MMRMEEKIMFFSAIFFLFLFLNIKERFQGILETEEGLARKNTQIPLYIGTYIYSLP